MVNKIVPEKPDLADPKDHLEDCSNILTTEHCEMDNSLRACGRKPTNT